MVNFRGLTAKAKQFAQRNPDKVNKVLGRAGDFVDKRTGRKYERHVNTVQQKAQQFLGGGRSAGGRPTDLPGRQGRPGDVPGTGRPGDLPGTGRPDPDRGI